MEKIVDVERLNRHLSEVAWAPTVEISRTELLALLSRLEQAEQDVARVREALSNHPRTCDQHTEDDPVKCGWKRAVIDVQHALDGDARRCPECDGTGDVQVRFAHGVQAQDCSACFGTGEIRALDGDGRG